MAYEWDSNLETGYAQIDNQHKQLVGALNSFMEAFEQGKGQSEVEKTLEFLIGYTLKHFADEEKLQIQHEYPEYLLHKRYHEEFKAVARGLEKRVAEEGPTDELMKEVAETVGSWLLNHIQGDDFKLAAYIRTRQ